MKGILISKALAGILSFNLSLTSLSVFTADIDPQYSSQRNTSSVQEVVLSGFENPSVNNLFGKNSDDSDSDDSDSGEKSTFDKLKEKGGNAVNKAKDAGGKAVQGAKEAGSNAIDAAKDVGGKAVQSAKDVGGKAVDGAKSIGNSAVQGAKTAGSNFYNWVTGIDYEKFSNGWDYALKFMGTTYAAVASTEYIDQVGAAIEKLKVDVNSSMNSARPLASEAGYVAEKWAADTFNINAALNGSKEHATVVGSNKLGSADVSTSWKEDYSLKYYKNAKGSAKAQAMTIFERYCKYKGDAESEGKVALSMEEWLDKNSSFKEVNNVYEALYSGQGRIIPSDQLDDAVQYLRLQGTKQAMSDSEARQLMSESTFETVKKLSDRIKAPDGTESMPLTLEEARAITELSKEGKFDPSDFRVSVSELVKPKYMISKAMDAGVSAAMLRMVLTMGPEVYKIIVEAAKTGKIDQEELKKTGIDGVLAGSEGFIEGSVSSLILQSCKLGKFGAQYVDASPATIGALTVIVIDAVRYGYSLSKGEITPADYSNLIAEEVIVTVASQGAGTVLSILLPMIPFSYMIGSMAGSMVATAGYDFTKEMILEVKDNGGFAAIVPTQVTDGLNVAKETVSNMKMSGVLSDFKTAAVTTLKNGTLKIKPM